MNLKKVGIKFFTESSAEIELTEFIPVFHRWIQTQAVPGVLIDVADYSHVPAGPGIMLVAHEGHISIDQACERRGLICYKRDAAGEGLATQLETVCSSALSACCRLENELEGRIRFRGEELQLFANDRLNAPNNEATYRTVHPSLRELCSKLYPDGRYSLDRVSDTKERFSLTVTASEAISCDTLRQRLAM